MTKSIDRSAEEIWLASYLYYAEPWEEFLIHAVRPLVDKVINTGLASQYFFIRYWEKGPHIRLRFKGDAETLEAEVRPLIVEHFNAYYAQKPSQRQEQMWDDSIADEHRWYPNNSVQFITYEPETDRYGGDQAITVAERQFQASSKATFEIIADGLDSWDYNRALGAAIQLHLGFAYGVGMDQEEAKQFFSQVFKNWLPRAYYFFEPDISQDELAKRRDETLKAFEANFENQKTGLIQFLQSVWEAFQAGETFDQQWINNWVDDMKQVKSDLVVLQKAGQITAPKFYMENIEADVAFEKKQLWSIYDSYIHMINNRLGIMNRDEGYLAYLMRESIKAISNIVENE